MATVVTLRQAHEELARLLKLVEAGEEVIIANGGRFIARLTPPPDEAPPGTEGGGAPAPDATEAAS